MIYRQNRTIALHILLYTCPLSLQAEWWEPIAPWIPKKFLVSEHETTSHDIPLNSSEHLAISVPRAILTIETWDKSHATVRMTRFAKDAREANKFHMTTSSTDDSETPEKICTITMPSEPSYATITVYVPRATALTATIDIEGDIIANTLTRRATLTTQKGSITATCAKPNALQLITSDGSVSITCETWNAKTSSLFISAARGQIKIIVPEAASARINFTSMKGNITSTLPLTIDAKQLTHLDASTLKTLLQEIKGTLDGNGTDNTPTATIIAEARGAIAIQELEA